MAFLTQPLSPETCVTGEGKRAWFVALQLHTAKGSRQTILEDVSEIHSGTYIEQYSYL